MIGPIELIILFIFFLNIGLFIWSITYITKKADEIKRRNPLALKVWQVVVIHIFIIIVVNSILSYLVSILINPVVTFFIAPFGCLVLPIYMKAKYKKI